ncbi:hypothetical protein BKA82DRAFT_4358726 [Pisolithus tinctorius]|nr:hypothetical protein BKA82DRAFT_4358726 [Pisolithus tinctorius]
MPKPTNNPHLAVQPDHHDVAAAQLALYWTLNNDLEKEEWDCQILQEQQEAAEKARLEEEEQERSWQTPSSSLPKLQHTDSTKWILLSSTTSQAKMGDGLHSFIPLASAQAKGTVTKDKDLTWEEFSEATHRLANAMKENNWEANNISNHVKFWLALENHPWRHGHCEISKRALLVYQARVCRRWHDTLDTKQSFNIMHINDILLAQIRDELVHSAQVMELESLKQFASAESVTTSQSSNAKPPAHGTTSMTPSQSMYTGSSTPGKASTSAQDGNAKKAAQSGMTPCTSALAADSQLTALANALERRWLHPCTPYKADAWERALQGLHCPQCFALIPEGL